MNTVLALVALTVALAAAAGPCDIYSAAGTPCVAAHSMVRALLGAYNGPLYQVTRASDKTTKDIGVLSAGGYANAATQDSFCASTDCTITAIYDQSGKGNHLTVAHGGGWDPKPDKPANATKLPLTINGNRVYGLWVDTGGMGYRNDKTTGIPTGDQAEAIYMVASGTHVNGGCCFDYGNAETDDKAGGPGMMEAVYVGSCNWWTYGAGNGPWVMADLEVGLYACNASSKLCPSNPSVPHTYVTAMLKGHSGGTFALKSGNAQSGSLTTAYSGPRPNGYSPMKKQGAIILGIGGDNSDLSDGSFYEGAMVAGNPSDATDDAVQQNIVAAGYK